MVPRGSVRLKMRTLRLRKRPRKLQRRRSTRLQDKRSVLRGGSLNVLKTYSNVSKESCRKGNSYQVSVSFNLNSSHRFYLIERTRNGDELREEFRVLGSTGNVRSRPQSLLFTTCQLPLQVYTVVVDKLPSCDCSCIPSSKKSIHFTSNVHRS